MKQTPESAAGPPRAVQRVRVHADRAGQRLDNFLIGQLKGAPRSLIYRLLRTGQVRVNGARAKPDRRLETGDEIRIPPLRIEDDPGPARAPAALLARLEQAIVLEDRNLLVLDKPSGLASHGGSGLSLGAIEALRQLRPRESLELVHRLDRDTSGLLLVARRRSALLALQQAIREGQARKTYLALLRGRLHPAQRSVEAPLRKSVLRGGERMVSVDPQGKPSRSLFRALASKPTATLAEVRIETGRTHQIRVHAAYIGHPLAGDEKYGDAEFNRSLRAEGLQRLFLHAAAFEVCIPAAGIDYSLSTPLPAELAEPLTRLGL